MRPSHPRPTLDDLLAHREWVRSLARRVVGDSSTADDLEQETWLAALRAGPPRHGAVRAWLAAIVRNVARNTARSRMRRTRHERAASARSESASAAQVVEEAEVHARLVASVLALDEPYRSTVLFRFFHGLDVAEIAVRTAAPVETVKTRIRRAVARLRERMDEEGRDDRRAWALLLAVPGAADRVVRPWGMEVAMGSTKKLAVAGALLAAALGITWTVAVDPPTPRHAVTPGLEDVALAAADAPDASAVVRSTSIAGPTAPDARIQQTPALQRVVVRSSDGSVVSGAILEVFELRERRRATAALAAAFGDPSTVKFRSVADSGGAAALPRDEQRGRVVVVRAPGFAPALFRSGLPEEVVLVPGCALAGRVLDTSQRPVPGATVLVAPRTTSPWLGPSPDVAWAAADADGRFLLRDLAPGTVQILAGWPGGTPSGVLVASLPSAAEVDVTLRGGGKIVGRVTEETTWAPSEGALVTVESFGDGRASDSAQASARTDADGNFRITGFGAESWNRVTVEKDGWYLPARDDAGCRREVPSDGETRIDLSLRRGGRIAGHVIGPEGPVEGARVVALDAPVGTSSVPHRAVSAADGGYEVPGVPHGPAAVLVFAPGLVQAGLPVEWPTARDAGSPPALTVEVRPGAETRRDLTLVRGLEVSGRVLREDGSAAAGAVVSAWNSAPYELMNEARVEVPSDGDGRFALRGIAFRGSVHVSAAADGASASKAVPLDPTTGARDVVLRLVAGPTVPVTVRWPDPAEVPAAVWLLGNLQSWMDRDGDRAAAFAHSVARRVPADGRFDAAVSRGSTCVVRVVAPGFAPADSEPFTVPSEGPPPPIEIHPQREVPLAGTVVVAGSGTPVARAAVRLFRVGNSAPPRLRNRASNLPPLPVAATTDDRGAFAVAGLVQDRYEVEVDAEGFLHWQGSATVPGEELRIEVARLGALSGRVRFADGAPAVGVAVTTTRPEGSMTETRTDDVGRFAILVSPTNSVSVGVAASLDGRGANVRAASSPRARAGDDLDIVVEPGLEVAGTLTDAAGVPFAPGSVAVAATRDGPRGPVDEGWAILREGGKFSIRGLASGAYRVRVTHPPRRGGRVFHVDPAESVAAGTLSVALVARSGHSIDGVVSFPSEAAPSVRRVLARRPGVRGMDANREPGLAESAVAADGRFRIDGLDAGRWRLVVQDDQGLDSPWQAGEGAFAESGASDVRLTLSFASTVSGVVEFEGQGMQNCDVVAQAVGDPSDACAVISWFDGKFTFVGLEPHRRYDLVARREGLVAARTAGVQLGSTGVRLVLTRGLAVRGRLLRRDGTVPDPTWITFLPEGGGDPVSVRSDGLGAFEATGLTAGTYTARVRVAGSAEPVELGRVSGGDSGVKLALP